VAKGQKRSNRETRKPKQDKPKPAAAPRAFLNSTKGSGSSGPKGLGR
jgi:hypothetical protein